MAVHGLLFNAVLLSINHRPRSERAPAIPSRVAKECSQLSRTTEAVLKTPAEIRELPILRPVKKRRAVPAEIQRMVIRKP